MIDDFLHCPNKWFVQLDGSFMTDEPESVPLPPDLFVMPEYYYLAGGGRDPLSVYANRKSLEERDDLHVWLTRASDQNLPDALPFSEGHSPRVRYVPRAITVQSFRLSKGQTIVFCWGV
jgi:hypothetical protein